MSCTKHSSLPVFRSTTGKYIITTYCMTTDAWKEAQAAAPALVEAPPAVQEQAAAFGRAVWQAALALAEQQIAEVRAETDH